MRRIVFFIVLALVLTACVRDGNGNLVSLKRGTSGLAFESTETKVTKVQQLLKAQVKGSIYSPGEAVSVFGTCMNASDEPLETGTYATMSSWYPNGTLFFTNVSMQEMQPGYYVYNGNMSVVQGTYLTEMLCHVNGSTEIAKAWGEWQNPFWVKQILDTQGFLVEMNSSMFNILNNISGGVLAINDNIVYLNSSMAELFNITWTKMNQTDVFINDVFQNLTQQITYVAQVANSSVDRNDSYLAILLQQLSNWTNVPNNGYLSLTEEADPPYYWKEWTIRVEVKNEYNRTVGYPVVSCFINTTNNPPTVNQQMTAASGMKWNSGRTVDVGFQYTEKIRVFEFYYDVWCEYS